MKRARQNIPTDPKVLEAMVKELRERVEKSPDKAAKILSAWLKKPAGEKPKQQQVTVKKRSA